MKQLGRLLHPTDLSVTSEAAFRHALRIALAAGARLRILHVAADIEGVHREDFPGVRDTLARWGVIPEGSPAERVADTGMDVKKIKIAGADPVAAIADILARRPVDLIVLATHRLQRRGRPVAESMARRSPVPALFVPEGVAGFVDAQSGEVQLRNVLICVDHDPDPRTAVQAASTILDTLNVPDAAVTLLYAGEEGAMPELAAPATDGRRWETRCRPGDAIEEILGCARELCADLIVMTTRGHVGFMDALRGSTTERVLRRAECPLLAVPAV